MHVVIDARLIQKTGVGRYIRNLVDCLAGIDRINIYTLLVCPEDRMQLHLPGNFRLFSLSVPWHSLSEQLVLPVILNFLHPDVVHIPYVNYPVFYRGRTVVTIHDLTILTHKTGRASTRHPFVYEAKHAAFRFILNRAIAHAAVILTVSESVSGLISGAFPQAGSKLVVAYEGIDPVFRKKVEKKSPTPAVTGPYFLYVGNAYPHKNLETLLRAFEKIRSDHPEYTLALVGPDDYFYRRLKSRSDVAGVRQIVFPGPLTDMELKNYYLNARVAVFPSLDEGFGLPALEALSLGTKVVCSDIPVFREMMGEYARFFDPNRPEELAAALMDNRKVKQPPEGFFRKFSWDHLAVVTRDAYRRAAGVL